MPDPEQKPRRIQVTSQHEQLVYRQGQIVRLFRFLSRQNDFPMPPGELSIAFLPKAELCRVHRQFSGDPTPTDVLTFPADPAMDHAGEICVCVDTAMNRVRGAAPLFSRELTLYLLHGWLHLCGLDDHDPLSRQEMRTAESELLKRVGQADLLPTFGWRSATS